MQASTSAGKRKERPLPSLFDLIPTPPRLAPHLSKQTISENKVLQDLGCLLDDGVTVTILSKMLREEARQERLERKGQAARDEDGDADGARSEAEEKGKGKGKGRATARRVPFRGLPEISVPEAELPADFPSGDLLNSIHAHASTLLGSSHFLLPRLTPEDPFLPPTAISSIEAVQAELEELEEKLVKDDSRGSKARWAAHKRGRLTKKGEGERKEIWRNVERSFDAESLVALGMLLQLLAADARDPETPRPASALPGRLGGRRRSRNQSSDSGSSRATGGGGGFSTAEGEGETASEGGDGDGGR